MMCPDFLQILICPDSFKGSLSAAAAAAAMAAGIQRVYPAADLRLLPLADGGEGTLSTLINVLGGELRPVSAQDPLGRPLLTEFGLLTGGKIAVVELAQTAGLTLLQPQERDPLRTSTYGTGKVINAAMQTRVEEIWIGLGGSATNDGGAGIAQALGFRLLDAAGLPLGRGGKDLLRLQRIEDRAAADLPYPRIRVLSDVRNPLTGPEGAAAVFAPQKGATPEQVILLDQALEHYAEIIRRDLGVEIRLLPGAGAAGGTGGGLVAFCGATLERGIDWVLQAVDFPAALAHADLVMTGEGRLDEQSRMGKVVSGVGQQVQQTDKPLLILAGQATASARMSWQSQGVDVGDLTSLCGSAEMAQAEAAHWLAHLAATMITQWLRKSGSDPQPSRS
jgi:glycerate kinase